MGYMEKLNLSALVGTIAIYAWYASRVVPQLGNVPVEEISYKWAMGSAVVAGVVLTIMLAIVLAIFSAKELEKAEEMGDERDREIELRGDAWSGYGMSVVTVGALIMILMDLPMFWVANALFTGGMLAALLSCLVKFVFYRRGF